MFSCPPGLILFPFNPIPQGRTIRYEKEQIHGKCLRSNIKVKAKLLNVTLKV